MVSYYGDFAEDDTVNIPFNTFDSNDPSNSVTATDLILSDIFVHKDGSATAITTDGATVDVDAPGVGAHMITIDTSIDAAYSVGSEYAVRVNGVTVDGGTVNAWIGAFSIERAGGVLALVKAGVTLATDAITSAKIADNAFLAINFGADFLTSAKIAPGAFVADNFAANSLNGKGDWNIDKTSYSLTTTPASATEMAKVPKSDGTSTWNATALGAINTEVDNALNVTTYAEPAQGLPAATTTLQNKIGFLYKAWRNKSVQNATTYELYNDDASTVDHKATCSDDATSATKGEVATGP